MKGKEFEYLIVGSGAGGATLAMELSKRGRDVCVVERGKPHEKVGTALDTLRYYDFRGPLGQAPTSIEGVILWRALMAGGSTVVSAGNGVRALEKQLAERGIDLTTEFAQVEQEARVAPLDERLLSGGSRAIRQAAGDLGYKMEPMPKLIDPVKCKACGNCAYGCPHNAKWTALEYLAEAGRLGADVRYNHLVHEVVIENGKARGVRGQGPDGAVEIRASHVILAAGGLGTPVILLRSGVSEAGKGLFVDLFTTVYGETRDLSLRHEPQMAVVNLEFHKTEGFLLSPMMYASRPSHRYGLGLKALTLPVGRTLALMVKIADEANGQVFIDGRVSKPVTDSDRRRLARGSAMASEILVKAGADPKSLTTARGLQGAHPGGTAALGAVVDHDLQTRVENLFVCDASVLPVAPGLPPILTIAALAKRLATTLAH